MLSAKDRALNKCCIIVPSAINRCPVLDKDKYLETLFGNVNQATN